MPDDMLLSLDRAVIFSEGLDHPECVTVHPLDGSIWAGGEAGQIYRIAPDGGAPEEIANTGGFVLGVAIAPDGSWLAACDTKQGCVWRLDLTTRRLTKFASGIAIPNHLCFTADGRRLFVSDSGAFGKICGKIYCFDEQGRGGIWHEGPFSFANGIALAPDEKALFVCCTWRYGVERIAIDSKGGAGARSIYAELPRSLPDGLTFAADGALIVACYTPARLWLIPPGGGTPQVLIEDWEAHLLSNPTNVARRGQDLFVANLGRWHITRIALP